MWVSNLCRLHPIYCTLHFSRGPCSGASRIMHRTYLLPDLVSEVHNRPEQAVCGLAPVHWALQHQARNVCRCPAARAGYIQADHLYTTVIYNIHCMSRSWHP